MGPCSVASSTNWVFGILSVFPNVISGDTGGAEPGLAPDFFSVPYPTLNRFLPFFCLFFGVLCRSFVINKKKNGAIPVFVRFALVNQWKKNDEVVGRICERSYPASG